MGEVSGVRRFFSSSMLNMCKHIAYDYMGQAYKSVIFEFVNNDSDFTTRPGAAWKISKGL